MYTRLHIYMPLQGGYLVQEGRNDPGSYSEIIAALSTKVELLKWLDLNLESRSPDLVDRRPQPPASTKDTDDEIPF